MAAVGYAVCKFEVNGAVMMEAYGVRSSTA